jgi:hypothetical protein
MNNLPYLSICKDCEIKECCGSVLTGPPICALKNMEVPLNSVQQLKQAIALVRKEAFLINHKPGGTLDQYLENLESATCLR